LANVTMSAAIHQMDQTGTVAGSMIRMTSPAGWLVAPLPCRGTAPAVTKGRRRILRPAASVNLVHKRGRIVGAQPTPKGSCDKAVLFSWCASSPAWTRPRCSDGWGHDAGDGYAVAITT
jgi:hypothetical protein